MKFECPNCEKSLEMDATLGRVAGQVVKCPACGKDMKFPKRPAPSRAEMTMDAATQPADARAAVRTLWAGVAKPGNMPTMSLKSCRDLGAGPASAPRKTDSISSRLNVMSKQVVDAGHPVEPPPEYELLRVLGEGGMGVVYRARQTSVDRTVALKMIKPSMAKDHEDRNKFLCEAVATGDLDHPNIVPIYDLGSNKDGILFYAMKEVRGISWKDAFPKKSPDENLGILLRVADAIAFAHSKGVIHRDLKPENVMLGDYGEVLVMDWGLAAAVRDGAKAERLDENEIGGTPCYMPPEMAKGETSKIGFGSDVYLLGAILYEIVTGKRPHAGEDAMKCLENAAANRIEPTEKTGELLDIALKALATEPGDRYGSVKDFQAAVREFRQHEESIVLSAHAEEELAAGEKTKEYGRFTEAVAGYRQALRLWERNARAAEGLPRARLAYATCAYGKDDFDLALSLLDPADKSHGALLKKVRTAREERAARQQRMRTMKIVSAVSAVVAIAVLSVGIVWVGAAQRVAVVQRDRAEKALADFASEQTKRQADRKSSAPALVETAKTLILAKNFDTALIMLGTAVEYDPKLADAQLLITAVQYLKGQHAEALASCRAYAALMPDDPHGRRLVEMCQTAATQGPNAAPTGVMGELLSQKGMPTLGAEFSKSAGDKLKLYQAQVAKAWPGAGMRGVEMGTDGKLSLSFGLRKDVVDLTPLQGIPLSSLNVSGTGVRDLSPLKGMPLTSLILADGDGPCLANDLTPLKGMKTLTSLVVYGVRDLSPLAGMPLTSLTLGFGNQLSSFTDLSPLKGMPLTSLNLQQCHQVTDLTPLKGMPLTSLNVVYTKVTALSPLKGMPLTSLDLRGTQVTDLSPLKGMALTSLNLTCTKVTDLSPLKGMPLLQLNFAGYGDFLVEVSDLSPLKGMALTSLDLQGTKVTDLTPLKGMPLTKLNLRGIQVRDLSPLAGMPLTELYLQGTPVTDLTPLKGMQLWKLDLSGTLVTDLSPLKGMPLGRLDFDPKKITNGMDVIREMKTSPINGMSAADFWKRYDAGEFK